MHTSETEKEEGVLSYHSNLLSPWHRHTEVLNGQSLYSTRDNLASEGLRGGRACTLICSMTPQPYFSQILPT